MMEVNHNCCHDELIQEHSIKIKELDTRADYKEQAIMELKDELKEMNVKIDSINNNVNKLILNSETSDTQIEKRVETIETRLDLYGKFFHEMKEDTNKRNNMQLTLYALIVALAGLLANAVFHFI